MNSEQISRTDFPADGGGYDRASVDAHLVAVAAWAAALGAQVTAIEVERDALRRQVTEPEPAGDPVAVPTEAQSQAGDAVSDPSPEVTARELPERPEASGFDDEVSARLLATRLVLEGSQREQIVARLAEGYELDDVAALVDDVLARLA